MTASPPAILKAEVSNKVKDFRNLENLMQTANFDAAWKADPDNIWVRFAIINGNVEEVRAWIKETLTQEVGEMSLRQLRLRAGQLGIVRVTIYTKDELIVKIIQAQDARKAQNAAG
jgi:hypothetical protein